MLENNDSGAPLRVLIVEDVEDDAELLVHHLQSGGYAVDWKLVESEHALTEAMEQTWDIIFSDYSMPGFSGLKALEIVRLHDPDVPLIFVSGTIGEEVAVEAMKSGAQDYVMKGHLKRLLPAIGRELSEATMRRERREAELQLEQLSLVVQQAPDSVFITDPHGLIEYVNPAFEKLTGYSTEDATGQPVSILRSGLQDDAFYQELWQTILQGKVFYGVFINRKKNGELFYEEKLITPLKDKGENLCRFVSTGRDITERIHAEEARAQLAAILEATPDMVAILEPDGCLRYLNSAGRKMLGLHPEEAVEGKCLRDIFPEPMAQQLIVDIIPNLHREGVWSGESLLKSAGGGELPVSQVFLAHRDAQGEIEYLSAISRDISERKNFESQLQHQATHDQLTGLPNRFFLAERFILMLENARRHGQYVAVLFMDLDNFKRVNDSLGHASGDYLLQQVGRRLRACLRPNDTVARHGGDEFAIVIGELERPENALVVLNKIHSSFELPVLVGTQEVYATFSTGIALYPHDGEVVDDLLRHADTAMYKAKASGSSQYRFYAPDMNARGHELLELEADLRHALEHKEFVLHYQPQIDIRSGRLVGMEALIRWQHPKRGLVSPAEFIPLLENTGMIIPVGEWVLYQACNQHRAWREQGYLDLRISVNVSANQFNDEDLLEKVRRVLRDESMPSLALELEITENIVMLDPLNAAAVLQSLSDLGVRLAIDDFGTGYSSLAYLKRFPLHVLKIDRTFVRDLTYDSNDAAIVEASVSLAKKLGLEIVAEGVESKDQLDFLRSRDCDLAQGYYLSRPVPAGEMSKLLATPVFNV